MPNIVDMMGRPFVDYWNPATVYPEFADNPLDGVLRLARVRVVTATRAIAIAKREGWDVTPDSIGRGVTRVNESHLWRQEDDFNVSHAVMLGNKVVKERQIVSNLRRIPVVVGGTAGLPDDGQIDSSNYQATFGQSLLASNEAVYNSLNRHQSFMQQLLRDTANPRWFQKKLGNKSIITPEDLYKRGIVYSMNVQEDIGTIPTPAIPVELTQQQFSMRNQAQRGGFSDITFGNVVQEITSVLMAQAAESAQQLLAPFHGGAELCLTEVTDNWYQTYIDNPGMRPKSWLPIPASMRDNTRIQVTYSIKVPGDLTSRVDIAPMSKRT